MGVWRFYIGEATRETRQAWFVLRVGGFVMPGTRAAVPRSGRAGAALLSGRKRKTTMVRELERLTRSMRASSTLLLMGTATLGKRWLTAA